MDLEDIYLFIIIKCASPFTKVMRKKKPQQYYTVYSVLIVLKGIQYKFKWLNINKLLRNKLKEIIEFPTKRSILKLLTYVAWF